MLCPYCKEEIADGAIKCKHCQSMLNTSEVSSNFHSDDSRKDNGKKEDSTEEDSDSLQNDKIRIMFEEKKYRVILGIPIFAKFSDQLAAFWWWALPGSPINPIVYILGGMWKKGLVLAGVYAAILGIIKYVPTSIAVGRLLFLLLLILMFYVGAVIDYDIYRKKYRNEDFWW